MTRQTNADRIIELLRSNPGLDDDEIAQFAGVSPRQQVNQICRWLTSRGTIRRSAGPRGKIVNYVVGQRGGGPRPTDAARSRIDDPDVKPRILARQTDRSGAKIPPIGRANLDSTLIIMPCSGAKRAGGSATAEGPAIFDSLPSDLAARLKAARESIRARAKVDERAWLPAWQRYEGFLYGAARHELSAAVGERRHVAILSGGYGVVLADEPIGNYEAVFKRSWWPVGLIESVLEHYAQRHKIRHVRAVCAETTSYREIIGRAHWNTADVKDAWLLSPIVVGGGAMVKSPRAQGEALAALLRGEVSSGWTSSDGLALNWTALR